MPFNTMPRTLGNKTSMQLNLPQTTASPAGGYQRRNFGGMRLNLPTRNLNLPTRNTGAQLTPPVMMM